MLYLDYAKKVEEGYILNFFADSEDDIEEVSGGKEFITKNGTNYGAPLPSSTVVITMPDKSRKTYILDDGNNWVVGGEPSGVAVEANVETTDNDEELVSLKVGDKAYKNSKMIPYKSTVLPSDEALQGVEYNEKVYRIPTGMTPVDTSALVTGGVVENAEYNGEIYNIGGFNKKFYQEIVLVISDIPSYSDGVYQHDITRVTCHDGKGYTNYENDKDILTFLDQQLSNENNIYVIKNHYFVVVDSGFSGSGPVLKDIYSPIYFWIAGNENKIFLFDPMFIGILSSNNGKIAYMDQTIDATEMTCRCLFATYKYDMSDRSLCNFDNRGNPIIDVKFDMDNSIIHIDTLQNDQIVRTEYNFTTLTSTVTELGPWGGDGLVPYTGTAVPGTDLKQVEYKGTVYNVGGGLIPYTGEEVATENLNKVEYNGTVYNVGGGSSGGVEIVLLQSTTPFINIDKECSVNFTNQEEYYALIDKYLSGQVIIRVKSSGSGGYYKTIDITGAIDGRGTGATADLYYIEEEFDDSLHKSYIRFINITPVYSE